MEDSPGSATYLFPPVPPNLGKTCFCQNKTCKKIEKQTKTKDKMAAEQLNASLRMLTYVHFVVVYNYYPIFELKSTNIFTTLSHLIFVENVV